MITQAQTWQQSKHLGEDEENTTIAYLIKMWPECADSKLCFHPAFCNNPRHIPDGVALRSTVNLHVDIQRARTWTVSTGQVVMKVDTVSVVFLQGRQQQVSFLPRCPSRAVHHHEGTYRYWGENEKGRETLFGVFSEQFYQKSQWFYMIPHQSEKKWLISRISRLLFYISADMTERKDKTITGKR